MYYYYYLSSEQAANGREKPHSYPNTIHYNDPNSIRKKGWRHGWKDGNG